MDFVLMTLPDVVLELILSVELYLVDLYRLLVKVKYFGSVLTTCWGIDCGGDIKATKLGTEGWRLKRQRRSSKCSE
jgi:hypothetical protein